MDDMTKFLGRTSLKSLGGYLTDLSLPLEEQLPPDRTVEELFDDIYDHLDIALQSGDQGDIRAAVEEMRNAARWVGLLDGLQAGARLVLALTGSGPVLY